MHGTLMMVPVTPASRAKTVGGRLRQIQSYEILIIFILVLLLALCIVVAQVVVDGNSSLLGGDFASGLAGAHVATRIASRPAVS